MYQGFLTSGFIVVSVVRTPKNRCTPFRSLPCTGFEAALWFRTGKSRERLVEERFLRSEWVV